MEEGRNRTSPPKRAKYSTFSVAVDPAASRGRGSFVAAAAGPALVGFALVTVGMAAFAHSPSRGGLEYGSEGADMEVLGHGWGDDEYKYSNVDAVSRWSVNPAANNSCCATIKVTINSSYYDATAIDLAVQYQATESDGPLLWSAKQSVSEDLGWSTELVLCRLRLNSYYSVKLYSKPAGNSTDDDDGDYGQLVLSHGFKTEKTGFQYFDDGPFVNVTGRPSWKLLTFQAAAGTWSGDSGTWFGLLTVDSEGYVVWMHQQEYDAHGDMTAYSVFDFFPDNSLAVLRTVKTTSDTNPFVSSYLYRVSSLGEEVETYSQGCASSPYKYNQLTHECRVDWTNGNWPVVSLQYGVSRGYGTYTTLGNSDWHAAEEWKRAYGSDEPVAYLGDEIVAWDLESNSLTTIYKLFDYINPRDNVYVSDVFSTISTKCDGQNTTDMVDWSHASSVAIGTQDNYLMTLRNLNTLISFYSNGDGIQWYLSSSLEIANARRYEFANHVDKFYQPHSVVQLRPSHNIMLFDDGNYRPNCTESSGDGCFSRAIEYTFNSDTLTAEVYWQFETPYNISTGGIELAEKKDSFIYDGGSVQKLRNGHYLVGFTDEEAVYKSIAYFYEVDPRGSVLSTASTPHASPIEGSGAYRGMTRDTIAGESVTCPL